MSDGGLFGPMFGSDALIAATDGRAWLRAMLMVEAAIARAGARAGLIPAVEATAIEVACDPARFDVDDLARQAVGSVSPVVPLVADLRAALGATARPYVHLGATSQDVLDTAMVLVTRDAARHIVADLDAVCGALADLATVHRRTVQIGRTLLQRAVPTTFGVVCAGWLVGIVEARAALTAALDRLGLQYGGPVGIHDTLGPDGLRLAALLAEDLGLPLPALPWHTRRGPVAALAGALGEIAGALGTIALAVVLLSQPEIGELAEGEPGGSSAMPHKRNPARAVLVTACAHQVPGLVATIFAGLPQELQRSAGRWQAEWPTVTDLLRLTGAAAGHTRTLLDGLRVDAYRMRANAGAAQLPGAAAQLPGAAAQLPGAAAQLPGAAAQLPGAVDALIDRALDTYRRRPP